MKLNDAIENCKKGYSVILNKDNMEYLLKEFEGEYYFVNIDDKRDFYHIEDIYKEYSSYLVIHKNQKYSDCFICNLDMPQIKIKNL